ncbi:MAG: hypothetical protein Q8R44_19815 [Novosphingobium sp.]|nr:hypothetical protein [Novosphingobium sp.]
MPEALLPNAGDQSLAKAAALFADRFKPAAEKPEDEQPNAAPEGGDVEELEADGADAGDTTQDESTDDGAGDTREAKGQVDPKAAKPEASEPPPSLSETEKARYKSLPPDAQAFVREYAQRREGDIERHLNSKSGELAETQRQIKTKGEEAIAGIAKRIERLDGSIADVESLIGKEPDWSAMAMSDPDGAIQKKFAWDNLQGVLNKAREERKHLAEEGSKQVHEHQRKVADYHKAKLIETYPEFKDEAVLNRVWTEEIDPYLASKGLPVEVRSTLVDHRLWSIARDAAEGHAAKQKLLKAKAEVRKEAKKVPKVTRPGTTPAKGDRERARQGEAMTQLKKKGGLREAENAFAARGFK